MERENLKREGKKMNLNPKKAKTEAEVFADHFHKKLRGGKIAGCIVSVDRETWGFQLDFPNGEKRFVWVMCDPEGNGIGFLDIEGGRK